MLETALKTLKNYYEARNIAIDTIFDITMNATRASLFFLFAGNLLEILNLRKSSAEWQVSAGLAGLAPCI